MKQDQIHTTGAAIVFGLVVFVVLPAVSTIGIVAAVATSLGLLAISMIATVAIAKRLPEAPALAYDPAWDNGAEDFARLG